MVDGGCACHHLSRRRPTGKLGICVVLILNFAEALMAVAGPLLFASFSPKPGLRKVTGTPRGEVRPRFVW
jgi:hypothetical protein